MHEIQELTYFGITFTKDMHVNYEKGNPVINSIFKQYDENLNGCFEDNEWTAFGNFVQSINEKIKKIKGAKINNSVVNHYDKKVANLEKQLCKIEQNFEKLDLNAYDNLIEFEEVHPCINRCACKNKEDIPQNVYKYDASFFEIGIYDEEKQAFSGECYKFGYIEGLNQLTKEEKKEYLSLLNKAYNVARKYKQYEQELDYLNKEYDKYNALRDLADAGQIQSVGSEEYENEIYKQYVNIRNVSNLFYSQIKDLEQKRNALWLKAPCTEEDNRQIEQYNIQIAQLQQASSQWSIRNSNQSINNEYGSDLKNACQHSITGEESHLETTDSTPQFSDVRAVENIASNISYSDANFDLQGNASLSNVVSFGNNNGVKSSLNTDIAFAYKRENLSLNSSTNIGIDASILNTDSQNDNIGLSNFSQSFGLQYKNISANVNGSVSEGNKNLSFGSNYSAGTLSFNANGSISSTESGTYTQLGTSVKKSFGKVSASSGITTDLKSVNYNFNTNGSFNSNIGESGSYYVNPTIGAEYNNFAKTVNLSQNINTGINYNKESISVGTSVNGSLNETFSDGKPQLNSSLTVTGSASYKNWNGQLMYTNTYFAGNSSNTIGGSVNYNKKNHSFGLSLSHSDSPVGPQNMLTAAAKLRF